MSTDVPRLRTTCVRVNDYELISIVWSYEISNTTINHKKGKSGDRV